MNALIGIGAGAAVALAVFGIVFRRLMKVTRECAELKKDNEFVRGLNSALATRLQHATRPDATRDDALRVRTLLKARRGVQDDVPGTD